MADLTANFDWRGSRLHILYLGRFHKLNGIGKPSECFNLEKYIKEPVQSAIERFIRDGALEECNLEAKVGHALSVPDIKDILRRHGQKASGNKSELAAIVIQVAKEEAEEKLGEVRLYKSTPLGLEAVKNFQVKSQEAKTYSQEARALAQKESHTKLLDGDPKAAFAVFVAFERKERQSNFASDSYKYRINEMRSILGIKPKIIGDMDDNSWRLLQASVAMKELWGYGCDEISWLPEDFKTPLGDIDRAIRLLRTAAEFQDSVADCQEWAGEKVKLVFDHDDVDLCEHCAALDGEIFNIKEIPEVPTSHCTSPNGCRCEINTIDSDEDQDSSESLDNSPKKPAEKLRQLKQLLDEGLIDNDEYQKKRTDILSRI